MISVCPPGTRTSVTVVCLGLVLGCRAEVPAPHDSQHTSLTAAPDGKVPFSAATIFAADQTISGMAGSYWPSAAATGAGVNLIVSSSLSAQGLLPIAQRVGADTSVAIDPVPFAVAPASSECSSADSGGINVAFNGRIFLVVWVSGAGAAYQQPESRICAARIDPKLGLIDTTPTVLLRSPNYLGYATGLAAAGVDPTGTDFLLAWRSAGLAVAPYDYNISASRLRASDLTIVDNPALALSTATGDQDWPTVAFDGSSYFVAWRDRGPALGIYGAKVRASDGKILPPGTIAVHQVAPVTPPPHQDSNHLRPSVAFDGQNHLIVWPESNEVHAARVRASDGAVLDTSPKTLATNVFDGPGTTSPQIGFDGTQFSLVWASGRRALIGAPVSRTDLVVGPQSELAPPQILNIALASGSGRTFVLWDDELYLSTRGIGPGYWRTIRWRTLGAAATGPAEPESVVRTAPPQIFPAASSDGLNHYVAWQEFGDGKYRIRGTRIRGEQGTVLDPGGIVLAPQPTDGQYAPQVASNGTVFLVTWAVWNGLEAVRVRSSDGQVLDSTPIGITVRPWNGDQHIWAVASDGRDFLLLLPEGAPSSTRQLVARIRGNDGVLLDNPPRQLGTDLLTSPELDLAWAHDRYIATFHKLGVIAAQMLTVTGELDGAPISIASPASSYALPRVVVGDRPSGVALVHWGDAGRIWGRILRLGDRTAINAAVLIAPADLFYGYPPRGVFDGEHFVVTWSSDELRAPATRPNRLKGFGTRASRVTVSGQLLDPEGILLSRPEDFPESVAALSVTRPGSILVSTSRYEAAPFAAPRVHTRWLGPAPHAAAPDAASGPDSLAFDAGQPAQDAAGPAADGRDNGDLLAAAEVAPIHDATADPDAPSMSTSMTDAATPDGAARAPAPDASPDPGVEDASTSQDTQHADDAGRGDVGRQADAGEEAAACSCRTGARPESGGSFSALGTVGLALLLARRRPRRRRLGHGSCLR